MKKIILVPALAGVLALSGVAMTGNTAEASKGFITMENARTIAVKSVGGNVTDIELKRKKSGSFYEVEVQSKGFEYDMDIDAKTGKILRKDKDELDDDDDIIVFNKKFITPAAAEKIALKKAKGTIVKVALDNDDNRVIYEIEVEDNIYEYELDIDAISGKILDFDKDKKDD